jgi:hypothetical protein
MALLPLITSPDDAVELLEWSEVTHPPSTARARKAAKMRVVG